MFKLCFGKSKSTTKDKRLKKKIETKMEEERILRENRIKIKSNSIDTENYKAELLINEEIITLYKKAIDEFTSNPNSDSNILSILRKENNILKHAIYSINSKIKIIETSLSETQKDVDNILDENSELNKIESKIFILKNLFYKKEHEILNLESFLKNLKKRKTAMTIEINNCDDAVFNKVLNDELLFNRNNYTKLSKLTISEKTKIKEKKKKIGEMKKEIEFIKNPQNYQTKGRSNLSENDIDTNLNLNLNSINLESNQINKTDLIIYKSEEIGLTKLNETAITISNGYNVEESFNKLTNDLKNNKETILKINEEIENFKKLNEKVEADISNLNNELSNKFCYIYKLEKKLDKLKLKKNNILDVNEIDDDIERKITIPSLKRLGINKSFEINNNINNKNTKIELIKKIL